jgi:hypothetical protein
MNASATFSNLLLKHYFNNDDHAGIGDASGLQNSAAAGSVYVRLCTDAVAPNASTIGTETSYTGYVDNGVAVARTTGGWTVTANAITNAADILFGACTAGTASILYIELWANNSGSTEADRIAWVELTLDSGVAAFDVESGITPKIAAGALTFTFV